MKTISTTNWKVKVAAGSRHPMAARFRGYLPVVVDVETGGFNSRHRCIAGDRRDHHRHGRKGLSFTPITPTSSALSLSKGANIEAAALEFTGIKLDHPLRMAVSEETALTDIFRGIRKALKANGCKRAILVGHNSSFDLGFLNAAVARLDMKRNPFHPFSSFDTATLAGLAYGQTVLAKACQAADIDFDGREAHSARYDTEKDRRAVLRHRQSLERNGRLGRLRRLSVDAAARYKNRPMWPVFLSLAGDRLITEKRVNKSVPSNTLRPDWPLPG